MTTIGDRIKKVRQEKHLTQQKFGEQIGLKQNSIAIIESGKRDTSDQTLMAICREFQVNETWLRTGEGEMFREQTRAEEIDAAVRKMLSGESEEFKKRLITVLASLKEEHWKVIEEKVLELAAGEEEKAQAPAAEAPAYTAEELAAYEKVRRAMEGQKGAALDRTPEEEAEAAALHAELDRQLAEEKRGASAHSSGSSDTAALIGRKILAASPEAQAAVSRIIEEDEA